MVMRPNMNRTYYFIDIELKSRRLIGWGTESKERSK
jgi:hypothetical protein